MDWSAILYGAIGGGGGAAVGTLAFQFIQKLRGESLEVEQNKNSTSGLRGGLVGGLAVLGMMIMPSLYKNMTLPRVFPINTDQIYAEAPVLEHIKSESPEDYELLIASIDKASRNYSNIPQEALNDFRQVYNKLVHEKTLAASPEIIREFDKLAIRQFKTYKQKKPEICTLVMHNQPAPALDKILNSDDILSEQTLMEKLFTAPSRNPKLAPDLNKGKKLNEEISAKIAKGLQLRNLNPKITNDGKNLSEHQKICDLLISLLAEHIKQSDADLINIKNYIKSTQ